MTMIARIVRDRVPIYLGDLLLSREGNGYADVDTPAITKINARLPAGTPRSVIGLTQKLNIISDRLVIAWAGNMLQARMLTREISKAVADGASTWQEVCHVIERNAETDRNEVSLIGTILIPGQGRQVGLQHFQYCAERRLFGGVEIVAAGTGADDLMEIAPQIISSVPAPPSNSSAVESFLSAKQLSIGLAGALVGQESLTGRNILDWWGGAIEIASIVGGRFQKASNILHTIWRVIKTENKMYEIRLVPKFIKYDYFEDVLIAQTLDVEVRQDELKIAPHFHVNEHALRLYTPLLRTRHDYDFGKFVAPNFDHQTLCCFVLIEERTPSLANYVRVYHSSAGDTPFQLNPSERNSSGQEVMRISFHERLKTDLERAISSATGLPAQFCQIGW